jgi:CheY-like chemotaxis protein
MQMGQTVVLHVEDEPIIRRVVALSLQRRNFTVLSARDSVEAIQILQTHRHVDVLLADVHLGCGLTGLDLAEYALKECPTTKTLLISGFEDSEIMVAERGLPFLRKPFFPKDLAARLRELLTDSVSARSQAPSRTGRTQQRSSPLPRAKSRAA